MGCTLWSDFALYGDPRITGYQCQKIMTDYLKISLFPNYSKVRSIDVAPIHKQSLYRLKMELEKYQEENNVVITHHGPSILSLPNSKDKEVSNAAYVSQLEYFIQKHQPRYWIHGHLHNNSNYQIGDCKVVCNPRGYLDERNQDFRSEFMVEL